ncbi:unnamed protein product [Sphagnum balticum]
MGTRKLTRMQSGRRESWPRQFMKKLLTFRASGDEFKCEDDIRCGHDAEDNSNSDEFEEDYGNFSLSCLKSFLTSQQHFFDLCLYDCRSRKHFAIDSSVPIAQSAMQLQIAVGTWNVAGKPPGDDLNIEEWLDMSQPADIYVLGFQEVVPLNAINVLWVEDETPKAMWEDLIRRTLNNQMGVSKAEESLKSYRSPPSAWHTNALYEGISSVNSLLNTSPDECLGSSLCNSEDGVQGQTYYGTGKQYFKEENHGTVHKWSPMEHVQTAAEDWLAEAAMLDDNFTDDYALVAPVSSRNSTPSQQGSQHYYSCVASKQMVGIFITIWVRSDLRQHVHNVKVCSVGCGIFNFLGNKGAISVSMSLHQTSFCFVCTHLASGHKEGDELRRNMDIADILRRTTFPRVIKDTGSELPKTIMAHDRIIWLGDLNYRVAASDLDTWKAVNQGDWDGLFQKDQLKLEQGAGHVFKDWQEGSICFPPTYKFVINSDQYYGRNTRPGEKRRTPAWCDRILWYGKGLRQLQYVHIESQLSDHRPVSARFMAEVEILCKRKLGRACTLSKNAKVEVEELLPKSVPNSDINSHYHVQEGLDSN